MYSVYRYVVGIDNFLQLVNQVLQQIQLLVGPLGLAGVAVLGFMGYLAPTMLARFQYSNCSKKRVLWSGRPAGTFFADVMRSAPSYGTFFLLFYAFLLLDLGREAQGQSIVHNLHGHRLRGSGEAS